MGIHITDTETFALYDSVSGFAFGPTFDSADEALSFCQMTEALATDDPRKLDDETLNNLYELWFGVWQAGHGTVVFDGTSASLNGGEWTEA